MTHGDASPAVLVRDLTVVRGERRVLPALSLEIPARQVVGLLGPSGSGKSTLMRAIVGVQVIESGTVTVLGHEAGTLALRDEVGVAQSPSVPLGTSRSGRTSFTSAGRWGSRAGPVRGGQPHPGRGRPEDHAGVLVRNLSGGQESRVSLACALVGRPSMLVLDEPTVGLDPILRRDLWNHFHDLVAQGCSLIVSSHVMDEATRCDRLVLLRDGQVLADVTPAELLERTGETDADAAFLALEDLRTRGEPVNPGLTIATTARALRQIRTDHRTIALIMGVRHGRDRAARLDLQQHAGLRRDRPCAPRYLPADRHVRRDVGGHAASASRGPWNASSTRMGKADFMLGYAGAFGALAIVQALLATSFAIWVCDLDVLGPLWMLVLVAVLVAVLGTSLGLLASAFARTEFQAVQFMPAFIIPQFLLCGLLVDRDRLPSLPQRRVQPAATVLRRRRDEGGHGACGGDERGRWSIVIVMGFIILLTGLPHAQPAHP